MASLYTLRAGADDLKQKPLLHPGLFSALHAHWQILRKQKHLPASLSRLRIPRSSATMAAWIEWLPSAEAVFSAAAASHSGDDECSWWLNEMLHRLAAISTLLHDYVPWMLPEYRPFRKKLRLSFMANAASHSVQGAISFSGDLENRLAAAGAEFADSEPHLLLAGQLRDSLCAARLNLRALAADLRAIEKGAESLAEEMDFSWLVQPGRQVLSIGYDISKQAITDSCYDLFASEARLATFLAVATYALPQQSWFRLEREHTFAEGNFVDLVMDRHDV